MSVTPSKPWPLASEREAGLAKLEQKLASAPDSLPLQFERACILGEMGREDKAQAAYLELLAQDPAHCEALNNLGTLLYATGYRRAARTAYQEAILRHPESAQSRVNLANLLLREGELDQARAEFEAALACEPEYPEAHQGLGGVLAELGERKQAHLHQRLGYADRAVKALPYRGSKTPVRVLLLVAPNGGNLPIWHLLDDRVFAATILLPEFFPSGHPLPEHDVILNAIGDADHSAAALEAAEKLLLVSGEQALNQPRAVLASGRATNLQRLGRVAGVKTACCRITPRNDLASPRAVEAIRSAGWAFPLLLRSPGFHNGRHFEKVASAEELPECLARLPGEEVLALEFLDARGPDGKFRKYRVMFVGGELYPLHLAISGHWKIHYLTAEMGDNAAHRLEEAEFLRDMESVLGLRATAALQAIERELGLDYGGIDFGLSPNGEILLFEANATMVAMLPEPDEKWGYRRAAVERIHQAVRAMLTTPSPRSA